MAINFKSPRFAYAQHPPLIKGVADSDALILPNWPEDLSVLFRELIDANSPGQGTGTVTEY